MFYTRRRVVGPLSDRGSIPRASTIPKNLPRPPARGGFLVWWRQVETQVPSFACSSVLSHLRGSARFRRPGALRPWLRQPAQVRFPFFLGLRPGKFFGMMEAGGNAGPELHLLLGACALCGAALSYAGRARCALGFANRLRFDSPRLHDHPNDIIRYSERFRSVFYVLVLL